MSDFSGTGELVQETLPCTTYMDDLAILLEADSAREAGDGHGGHGPDCVDGGSGELGWPRISARPQTAHVTIDQSADSDAPAQTAFGTW